MVNICPVCGYLMPYPPRDYHICPSCGTEFSYDDAGRSHTDLRADWIRGGMLWWSPVDLMPVGWDPIAQLKRVLLNNPSYTSTVTFAWMAIQALGASTSITAWEPTKRGRHVEGLVGSVPSANGTVSW